MSVYFLQMAVLIASIIVLIFEITEIRSELKKQKKHYWKLAGLIITFFLIAGLGAYGQAFQTVVLTEKFSLGQKNLNLCGQSENVCFYPSYKIDEPITLKIKDTWASLQYQNDYEVKEDNQVFINFIYLENKESNRELARNGLVLTYKTKMFLLSPSLISRIFNSKR